MAPTPTGHPDRSARAIRWTVIFGCVILLGACGSDNPTPDLCSTDEECAHLDDGDLCNGRARCGAFGQCTLDTKPVECPTSPCSTSQCQPDTGTCDVTNTPDGTSCPAPDVCFVTAECNQGICTGTTPTCPQDDNACTETQCQTGTGLCLTTPVANFTACDDDNLCTVNDRCLEGDCTGTASPCPDDDNPCTVALCDASTGDCGVQPGPDGVACDDDDLCTSDDACLAGQCAGGASTCAHLEGPCVAVTCDAATGQCDTTNLPDQAPCDDNNPCTVGEQCTGGSCTDGSSPCDISDDPCVTIVCDATNGECINAPTEGLVPCDDVDFCTANDVCLNGFCLGEPEPCPDDGNPCTAEGCVPTTGCVSVPLDDGLGCDDQNPCTKSSSCESGTCSPTAVTCPPTGNPCSVATCKPTTGECQYKPLGDGELCDDGNLCSAGDACQGFVCTPGDPVTCLSDGNDCTEESCDSILGCVSAVVVDGTLCDDDNACTDATSCHEGVCSQGLAVQCPEVAEDCLLSVCDPKFGCTLATEDEGTACDDQSACTTSDACQGGLCAGQTIECPASENPCVVITCDAESGCVANNVADNTLCDDDNACTSNTHCKAGACVADTNVECPPSTLPCRESTCDPGTGDCILLPIANNTPCDDTDPCTAGTSCTNGSCIGGLIPPCPSDDDPCTSDVCIPGTGCLYPVLTNGTSCNDGSACTANDTCQEGLCVGNEPVECAPLSNPCFLSTCNPSTGKCDAVEAPQDTPCNDGNLCTLSDGCTAGVCQGIAVVCPQDDNSCTTTACVPTTGFCATTPDATGTLCDDNNLCTVTDHCDGSGFCEGEDVPCPAPDTPCQVALCDGNTGQCESSPAPNGSPCIDTDPCTSDDFCAAGSCVSGTSSACQSTNSCMAPICNPTTGACSEVPLSDGIPCNDNNACTSGGQCNSGTCQPSTTTQCPDDNNPCTIEACNAITGDCESVPTPAPIPCNDANACTIGDHCELGLCVPNQLVDCPSSDDGCLVGTCLPSSGGCDWIEAQEGVSCNDGNACTSNDACLAGECAGQTVLCPVSETACQVVSCHVSAGCVNTNADDGTPCQEVPCLVGSSCSNGLCTGGSEIPCPEPQNPCLVAFCSTEEGCSTTALADETPCNDGDQCTIGDHCQQGECNGVFVTCPDDGPCQEGACINGLGCTTVAAQDGKECTDNDLCTLTDACIDGICTATSPPPCIGGTPCEPEACDPQTGQCITTTLPDGSACDDENPCTETSVCADAACLAESLVSCPDPVSKCLLSACLPETGQCEVFPAPDGLDCDDDSLCTDSDHCIAGVCSGVTSIECPHPGGCALATCEPSTGACLTDDAPDGTPCDDGLACNVGATCSLNTCESGDTNAVCCINDADCDDGTPCTQDACIDGRCTHEGVDLPACIGRILVVGADDGEVLILDATTLTPVPESPLTVGGDLQQIAVSNEVQWAYVTATDTPNAWTFDPFAPTAVAPMLVPATGPTRWSIVDGTGQITLFVSPSGLVQTYDSATGIRLQTGVSLGPVVQRPWIDPETAWLLAPSSLGTVSLVDVLAPQSLVVSTPWTFSSSLTSGVLDRSTRRLLLAAPDQQAIRVINAHNGASLPMDPLNVPAKPSDLAINTVDNQLLVSYPAVSLVRAMPLDNLTGTFAASVALAGQPDVIHHDPRSNRTYVLGAKANLLHVLTGPSLSPHPQSPVTILPGSVDVVTVWTRPSPIVINEVFVGNVATTAWIELHNPGPSSLALADWSIETPAVTIPMPSAPVLTIPAGDFAVICGDANPMTNGGISCDLDLAGLTFNTEVPLVLLRDESNHIVDRALLPSNIPTNQSMALSHPGFHNGRPMHWVPDAGSPGAPNSVESP